MNYYFLFTGIGMDSSVTPLRHGGLSLVQTTDFFYPLVDDPYMMGKNTVMLKKMNTLYNQPMNYLYLQEKLHAPMLSVTCMQWE